MAGAASDHHDAFELLQRAFRAPSPDAFSASLEDPFYEPCDRLLARRGDRLIGHALLAARDMLWGDRLAPARHVSWLATLPEYRGRGVARRVLEAVDQRLAGDISRLGILTTRIPHFFARAGWTPCGRISRYVAGARALLASLSDNTRPADKNVSLTRAAALSIRPWRHVELPALVRLYAANLSPGMFARSEDAWRWLISRRAFDQIYVATDSPGRSQLEDNAADVSGYVITKGNDVLELMGQPGRPEVARQLLERVCGDAIEMNCHHLGLFAPPGHSLTELFLAVGGHRQGPDEAGCDYLMAKLPDPLATLQWLQPQLQQRAEAAELARPCELGLVQGDWRVTLALTRRSLKITPGKASRIALRLDRGELTRLLLGASDVSCALERGRISASSRVAGDIAATLFPKMPLWRAPLDELME